MTDYKGLLLIIIPAIICFAWSWVLEAIDDMKGDEEEVTC